MMPPGARAVNDTGLAALTTPPCMIVGWACDGLIPPSTSVVPLICGCGLTAVTVSFTGCPALCAPAYHVACHVPLFSEVSPSGGAPLLKVNAVSTYRRGVAQPS